ncbi:hypothetical protein O3M35_000133 [Rhynocoris fuscipes]|uniref:Uncharacterized protein n=1 Tax=Rhynocoris fuscipes TaxID=488301 RepID=A0AAW1DKF9_9HEMI
MQLYLVLILTILGVNYSDSVPLITTLRDQHQRLRRYIQYLQPGTNLTNYSIRYVPLYEVIFGSTPYYIG